MPRLGLLLFCRLSLPALQLRLASLCLLLLLAAGLGLDGQNYIWSFLAEPLEVEVLEVLPERQLPQLLVVVVQPAELLRAHPQPTMIAS